MNMVVDVRRYRSGIYTLRLFSDIFVASSGKLLPVPSR